MVEFAEDRPQPGVSEGGKKVSPVFAAVRARGMINATMDALAKNFETHHKDENLATKWEFYNPGITGGTDMVMFREGEGFKVVTWDMMPNQTENTQKNGMVRRGDLVLMCVPRETMNEILRQDAQVAQSDIKASETAYKENLDTRRVTRPSDQETDQARGVGQIKVTTQVVEPPRTVDA
jgi:hypothetical protein